MAPLPTSLAGFSVSITQGPTHPSQQLLPIFSIEQTNVCSDSTVPPPSCIITAITGQIPVNLSGFLGDTKASGDNHTISITENGSPSASFRIVLLREDVHILTYCDSIDPNQGSGPCSPKITHADGTRVSLSAKASVGEMLSMYAVGLGGTRPAVPAGTLTPEPAPVTLQQFMMQYSYAIDPSASSSSPISPGVPAQISFTGLAPGQIGVYQVNFTVPAPPSNARSCDPLNQDGTTNPDGTNLVLTLSGGYSLNSARICVKLPDSPN